MIAKQKVQFLSVLRVNLKFNDLSISTVDDLLKLQVAEISAWLSDHEEELGIRDYEAILAREVAGKKRSTVVKGLKTLIGEE